MLDRTHVDFLMNCLTVFISVSNGGKSVSRKFCVYE